MATLDFYSDFERGSEPVQEANATASRLMDRAMDLITASMVKCIENGEMGTIGKLTLPVQCEDFGDAAYHAAMEHMIETLEMSFTRARVGDKVEEALRNKFGI